MANTQDLLGALLQRGMTKSSKDRIEHSLGDKGGLGTMLEQLGLSSSSTDGKQGSEVSSPLDALGNLGNIAKSMLGGGGQGNAVAAGGLGALLGAIAGGGGEKGKGAVGGGALALLGSMALKALRGGSQPEASEQIDSATRLAAGLRQPENAAEEKEVQSIADLTVKAMLNAAKADGRIDKNEMQKIVGELKEDGITDQERDFLLAEVRKPMSTEELTGAASNRQVAAQLYAASLLAIEVDSPAEKAYMRQLANDLDLDSRVVRHLHATLGIA